MSIVGYDGHVVRANSLTRYRIREFNVVTSMPAIVTIMALNSGHYYSHVCADNVKLSEYKEAAAWEEMNDADRKKYIERCYKLQHADLDAIMAAFAWINVTGVKRDVGGWSHDDFVAIDDSRFSAQPIDQSAELAAKRAELESKRNELAAKRIELAIKNAEIAIHHLARMTAAVAELMVANDV